MRHLMSAQSKGQHEVMKMLLYKRDGSPFWAMVASCPLATASQTTVPKIHFAPAARPAQQQQQQPGSSSNSESGDSSSGNGSCSSQLLLVVDITSSHAKRVGKYTLGRVLGAGASGVVHLGKNTDTGR
jgi:hypothetical protein